jgi:hypothetical protein
MSDVRHVVLQETTLPLEELDGDLGYLIYNFELVVGEEYTIIINGVERPAFVAKDILGGQGTTTVPYIGNPYFLSGPDTGEDYLLGTAYDRSYTLLLYTDEDGYRPESVTVSVYRSGYSSEQYKYMLMCHLRKYFHMPTAKDRYYTRDFFQKLFTDITVTKSSYEEFVYLLEDNMEYSAKNNVQRDDDITQQMIDERGIMLIEAFEKIGIKLEIVRSDSVGTATFTKPDGTVMVFKVTDGSNNFFINAVSGQEYGYAKKAGPYYRMEDMDVLDLDQVNYQMCGPDCFWHFDRDAATMTITGAGSYMGVTREEQVGSGTYTTLIFGADVSELNCMEGSNSSLSTIVLLQPKDFPLKITSFAGTYTRTWNVYTDNDAFRNYAWGDSISINWHTLDEWEG